MLAYKSIRWLIPLNKAMSPSIGQIIFFPHAGGNAYSFYKLAKQFDNRLQLYAVELPGKGERLAEKSFTHFSHLIPLLCNELMTYFTVPTLFVGHSMGALIAYECAKYIEIHYQFLINALCVSAQPSPCFVNIKKYIDPNMQDSQLLQRLQEIQGIPQEVINYPELVDIIIASTRGDCQLLETYNYHKRYALSSPIVCIKAENDNIATESEYLKWSDETQSQFILHSIAGGHFSLLEKENRIPELIYTFFK